MQRPEGQEGFLYSCGNCGQGFESSYGLKYVSDGVICKYGRVLG